MNRIGLVAGLALVFLGCGTRIHYMSLNASPRTLSPRSPDSVEVFTSGKPDRSFAEVGMIEAQQQSGWSVDQPTAILQKLRQKAADVGCDGIIVLGSNDAVVGSSGQYGGSVATLRGYRATCIVYKDQQQ